MPRVSLVIRCFNEAKHIGRLLHGIEHQTLRDHEVIVVDSGSTDGTLDVVAQHGARVLSIEPEEFSFGRALNRGFEAARGEIVVAASAHVYPVYQSWLEHLVAPFADERVALAYGKQRGDQRSKFSEQQVFRRWFPEESDPDQKHPFCNNANAAVRRSFWESLPYDEELTGLEDLEWAKRAQARRARIAYCADAEVVHVHEETPAQILNRYRREAIALKQIMPEQKFGAVDLVRLLSANVVNDAREALREGQLVRQAASIAIFRAMQFWGTYQGHLQHGPVSRELRLRFYYPGTSPRRRPPAGPSRPGPRIDYGRFD